jgi:hypothetical protein
MVKKKIENPVEVSKDETTLNALENKEQVSDETIINDEPVKDIKTSGLNKDIEDMLSGYKEDLQVSDEPAATAKTKRKSKKKVEAEPEQPVEMPSMISGALLLLMIDLLIPNIIAFGNNKLSKEKIKASDLQLDNKQKKELEPIADEIAKTIALQGNPLTVLIVTLLGIYGINLMALKSK